jgi:hypothetical protein
LQEIEVPFSDAQAYIVDILGSSRRSLGNDVKRTVDLSKGKVFTWAPVGTRLPLPQNLAHGGLLAEPPPSTWRQTTDGVAKPVASTSQALADEIETFLSGDPRRLCLLANENVDPGDRVAASYPAKAVYGNELYHLIEGGASRDEVAGIVKLAKSVPVFVGVLSSSNAPAHALRGALSANLFQEIVANVDAIIIGAFDGEGFLVWRC